MATPTRKRRLGRGLESLVGDPVAVQPAAAHKTAQSNSKQDTVQEEPSQQPAASPTELPVEKITANTFQPRSNVADADLEELAGSIKAHGVMQPVVVRPAAGDQYELIAGERRWRAAQLAGLSTIPVVVRSISDQTSAEWALIENMQRRDLNSIDRAKGLTRLRDEFAMTQSQIAASVGLDRSTVSNLIRLLELEPELIELVRSDRLSMGHARALLSLPSGAERVRAGEQAAAENWSVRRLETLGNQRSNPEVAPVTDHAAAARAANVRHLESAISEQLGTRVRIATRAGGKKGTIAIEFFDGEHFEGLLSRLGVSVDI